MKYDKINLSDARNLHLFDRTTNCGYTETYMREVRASGNQPFWAASYVISGGGFLEVADRKYELGPGMVCQRIPGMAYRLEFTGGICQRRFFIGIPASGWEFMREMHPGLSTEPVIEIGFVDKLITNFQLFIRKYGAKNEFSWLMATDLFELSVNLLEPERLSRPDSDPRIVDARKLLDNPDMLHLSLQEIARKSGLGYNNFRKLFTTATGVSPGDYRIEKRVEFARQMLSGGMSQAETADALGYSDVYAFARQFKQRTGFTPGEFLRSL